MANICSRIWKRVKSTFRAFQSDCCFSPCLGLLRILDELGGRIGLRNISSWAHKKKEKWILCYLKKNILPILEQYGRDTDHGRLVQNAPIWVCWWTGEESAPPLVKKCIASIRQNAGAHPVQLITRENFGEYLEIPAHILDKLQAGQICIANFSDYLRFSLLAKHGGLWLDATIFCSTQIPQEMFQMPVFTCKSPEKDCGYISRYRWTSFCFGGFQDGLLFRFMRDAFDAYWKKNEQAIDYLLVDYLIETACSQIPRVKTLLDAVPENNLHRDDLQAAMNAMLPAEQFDAVIQPDTWLYKLSWRENYQERTPEGKTSVYGHFLQLR